MNHCNASCSSKCKNYKIPTEANPLPSLSSDEDSFVVLWRDTDTDLVVELNREPVCVNIVDEAKQLIAEELDKMEQLNVKDDDDKMDELKSDRGYQECDCSFCWSEDPVPRADGKINESIRLPEMPELNQGTNAPEIVSIATLSSELTPEQVQDKVSEIVDENIRLKDTILQNNISMKSQYERILDWQQNVQKVHRAHKDKIMQARDVIEDLNQKNSALLTEVEKQKTLIENQIQEISFLKRALRIQDPKIQEKLKSSVETNVTEFELEVALKQLKVLSETIENLNKENATLQEENTRLYFDNDIEVKEFDRSCNRLRLSYEEDLNELRHEIQEKDDKIAGLTKQIAELEVSLCDTRKCLSNLPTVEEVANMKQQLATTQINLTNSEQAKLTAHQRIEYLNNQNSVLLHNFRECQSALTDMYAVKTQMEVYKSDFEEEKAAKETIKIEKEKLEEDMKNLQRRNQQLQEEIDLLRENEYVIPPSQYRHRPSAPSVSSSVPPPISNESPPLRRFACPMCNSQFRSLKLVEDHVNSCSTQWY